MKHDQMIKEDERLAKLIEANSTMKFFDSDDREYPGIQWTVYGLPETNEVVVRVAAAGRAFYKTAPSRLTYPAMIDRRFGIDVMDSQLAGELSNELWEEHGRELKELIKKSGAN